MKSCTRHDMSLLRRVSIGWSICCLFTLAVAQVEAAEVREQSASSSNSASDAAADVYRQAGPLIRQIVEHLNAAAGQLEAKASEEARREVEKAEQLFGAVRHLLERRPEATDRDGFPVRRWFRRSPGRQSRPNPPTWSENWWGWDEDWDPFEELRRIQERMDRLFDQSFGRFAPFAGVTNAWGTAANIAPDMDLTEDNENYIVRFDLPGVDKAKISVQIEGRVLTVSGTSDETIEEQKGNRAIRMERRSGRFVRSVTLPGPVDADKMEAKYQNGVLTVTVRKAPADKDLRSIPVY